MDAAGVQRLGKAGRLAALSAARRLAQAIHDEPSYGGGDLFGSSNAWLDRLETVLNAPRAGLRLEKALTGDAEDFDALIEVALAEDRSVMLAARLAEWLHAQVGGGDEPVALADFLAQGWPPAPGSTRRVTFVQEFLANLRAELSDAPREITMPLGEPDEFLTWLEGESGQTAPEEAPKPFDLPPPTPPATPAPPIELPANIEDDEVASEELAAPVANEPPATAPPEIHEQAVREHRLLRRWALVFQLGWVLLLFVGWRLFQQYRVVPPSPPPRIATATPTLRVAGTVTPPPSPRLTVKTPPDTQQMTPAPLAPEMSVAPGELNSQALALAAQGHHAEAVALFRRIVQIQAQDKSLGRLPKALVYARMAAALAALERWDEADASVERAQALLEELLPTHDAETALGVSMVADYWAARERWPLAARLYQKAVQAYEDTPAENSIEQLSTVNRLAGALRQIGEITRAEQLYRQLVKAYTGAGSVVATDAASASHNLANVLLVTNRAGEALRYYEDAFAWLAKAPASDSQAKQMATLMRANYERCLGATGLPPDEAKARADRAMPKAKP